MDHWCTIISVPRWSFATDLSVPCLQDPTRLEQRSKELQEIVNADQTDRIDFFDKTQDERMQVVARDTERRMRVGQIFGEGCFSKAEDFAAAALVFQHGNRPEHFFQTFLWAKRAVELGDLTQKKIMAWGLDRYLVNIGHKQLFASQFRRPTLESCWQLQQVEMDFPDELRKEYTGTTLHDSLERLKKLNAGLDCKVTCEEELKPSPRGTVPGFW